MSRGRTRIAVGLLSMGVAAGAGAQTAGPSPAPDHMPPPGAMTQAEMATRADRRFPQPVRAGDLLGRELLQPVESQPVLGRVAGLVRRPDGTAELVVGLDGAWGLAWLDLPGLGWRGFGPRTVSVPVSAVALLGMYVALMDLTPERLRALPDFPPGSAPAIGPDETVRIGLVRPFH